MSEDDITERAGGRNLAQKVNVARRNGPNPSGGASGPQPCLRYLGFQRPGATRINPLAPGGSISRRPRVEVQE